MVDPAHAQPIELSGSASRISKKLLSKKFLSKKFAIVAPFLNGNKSNIYVYSVYNVVVDPAHAQPLELSGSGSRISEKLLSNEFLSKNFALVAPF